jgi:endophilin-A
LFLKHSIQNLCTFNITTKCNGFNTYTIHVQDFKPKLIYGNGTNTETKVTGKYPVSPFNVPSYQLSSILVFRLMVSPSLKLSPPVLPSCAALYDFDAESPGELSFKEGDTINLKTKIDDNWYEGTLNGETGYFPVTYVSVLVPLP